VGLWTTGIQQPSAKVLFLPDERALSTGERKYIEAGERDGVANRYKCRIRDPWYVVPGTKVPDVLLSVFAERPLLMINDGQHLASNSLLCGYTLKSSSDRIAARWYTSLTLLMCELEIHALGGGVMVLVPREAGNLWLPTRVTVAKKHLRQIHIALKSGQPEDAYSVGDSEVLVKQLGLTKTDVQLIRTGIESLSHWRTSGRSFSKAVSLEDIPE
jgi:hypothetical protein